MHRSTSPAHTRARRAWFSRNAAAASALLATAALAAVGNHLAAKRAERRNPPRGNFVEVDGVRLHYIERGRGRTVVLIHGNGVTSEDYVLSGLFDRLAVSCRVIAIDRPGFGYSERPRNRRWTAADQARVVLSALTKLNVGDAVLVAHSWGTLVALQAGLHEPDRIAGLVLIAGYYFPTPRVDAPLLSGPAVPVLGDIMRFTVSPLIGWLMTPLVEKQIFSPAKVPPRFRQGFAADMSLRPSQLRSTAADTAMMPFEAAKLVPHLKEITGPVLVLTGDGDKIVSFKHQSRRLARELFGGEIQLVEGAGHMVHHTEPAQVGGAIEDFLNQIGFSPSAAVSTRASAQPAPA